ncbi:hypothetical protein PsYK624_108620 [Phanerochaete sordida]|uniref:Uncharacterized protein n=1 Tax=Phanerochaete sordida TaxID=48140 RepID=A0A9P3LGL9_9APHY|nr:hypothetical protein PsYK624_108620 [Phanerochaete sordida]
MPPLNQTTLASTGTEMASSSSKLFYTPAAAGLIALTPSNLILERTALMGGPTSLCDYLVMAPGFLQQQDADTVNKGEYPPVAAMTSGYVFRVENQATAAFLQRVGKTGYLTKLHVERDPKHYEVVPTVLYLMCVVLSTFVMFRVEDAAASWFLCAVCCARLLHWIVIRKRAQKGWKGMGEPGVRGDLLVLVSQDKWIRIKGPVDDLKAVTSGQWLQDMTLLDQFLVGAAKLLVYGSMGFAWQMTPQGAALVVGLFAASACLLGLANSMTTTLTMFDCVVRVGERKKYGRRIEMAEELILERLGKGNCRSLKDAEWALRLGIVNSHDDLVKIAEKDEHLVHKFGLVSGHDQSQNESNTHSQEVIL